MLCMCVFFPLHSTLLARDKSEFQMCSFFHHQFIRFDFFSHSISLSLDECASQFHFQIFSAPFITKCFPLSRFSTHFHGTLFFSPAINKRGFFFLQSLENSSIKNHTRNFRKLKPRYTLFLLFIERYRQSAGLGKFK